MQRLFPFIVLFAATTTFADKPNIILLMADDLGYETLSCNGGGPYKTPVLDRLAKNGLRFTNCHAQPLCTPSRVKIMTGRYNFRNYRSFGKLPENEKTFGHVMKSAGYATCIVGKWQLGRDRKLINHFGFDEHCLWWLENKSKRYMDVGELIENGKMLPKQSLAGKYGPDVVSDFMLEFITRHKEEPFFCWYPMILTHSPYVETPDSRPGTKGNKYFIDMVHYTDKIVGKIEAHLESLGLRENTIIIFTGDNGTGRGITSTLNAKPWPGGKGTPHETGTKVPLVVSWPASKARGVVSDDPIDFSDFLPTVAELGGTSLPKGVKIDGQSFAPQLRGEKGTPRDWLYIWYSGRGGFKARQWAQDRRFKLYGSGEFFDVVDDPLQARPISLKSLDVGTSAAHQKLKAILDRMTGEQLKIGVKTERPGKEQPKKKKRKKSN